MNKNTLRKDYFWNTIGVFFQNGTTILLLVAITRINGIDTSGLFSFASAVAVVLFAFGLWGGRLYQVSDTRREFDYRSYIAARIILAMAMLIAAAIFVLVNNYDLYKSMVILTLVLYKAVESVADSIYGVLQVNDGLSNVGKSLLYKSILGLVLFIITDILTGNIILSSFMIVLVNIVFVRFYDIRLARKFENIKIGFSSLLPRIREAVVILKRTVAIFAVTFLATFSINIPRFFIDRYDTDEIGYFGIIAVPITLIALIMSFILQPNIVQLSKMYSGMKYSKFKKVVNRVMQVTFGFGLLVGAGAFLLGVPVLNVIFGVDFSQHKTELMIIIVGGIANAFVAIFINLLSIMRKFKAQFYTLLFTNLALVVGCGLLVYMYGIIAGVSLFALANLVQVAILAGLYHVILKRAESR